MDTKECKKCGEVKSLDEYNKDRKSLSGVQSACRECGKLWRAANKERLSLYNANWRVTNAKKYHLSQANWRKNNPDKWKIAHAVANKRYKYSKMNRTVSWANDQLIAAYYMEAKRLEELTGIKFHVDHIIPLQGELVSGLHVETNLQLLTAHENIGKSNSFDPELFCA